MSTPDSEAGRETARAGLAAAIDRFPVAVALLKRLLFRQHLALNVTWATPLLETVARSEGIDLAAALWSIEPPRGWPERPLATDARATDLGIERRFDFSPSQVWRRHRLAGVIVRQTRRSGDLIGVRVLADGLEITAIKGALKIETFHGLGRILLDGQLPATVAIAACGRPVGEILSHDWLQDRPWRVIRTDDHDVRTAITFETGRVPCTMPWPAGSQSTLGEPL